MFELFFYKYCIPILFMNKAGDLIIKAIER